MIGRYVKGITFGILLVALVATGCGRLRSTTAKSTTSTETIAPASGQPALNGTDAMTQTTEVEDSRSEADGGVSAPASRTATARGKPAPASKAPAKKKHK